MLAVSASAQSSTPNSTQFWFDYDPTFKLSRNWAFDAETAIRFARDIPEPWREFSFTPNAEYTIRKWIDVTGGVALTRTHQTDSFGSFETKPYFGVRLKWNTPWRGIRFVDYARWEFRFQHNLDTDETQSNRRFRNRIQLLILIIREISPKTEPSTWIIDGEAFRTPGEDDVEERFKSRSGTGSGSAGGEDATWTSSVPLRSSESRATLSACRSQRRDDIFQFRLIHTIKKSLRKELRRRGPGGRFKRTEARSCKLLVNRNRVRY